jgi:endoglucanase
MEILDGFTKGVNLGGWLSQYSKYDHEHFKSYITRQDITQIADWGMDHVRLPFDYCVIENDDQPYSYQESGLNYIDNCLSWCKEKSLNLVLDLHRAPGYSFDATLGSNTLFLSNEAQQRLIALWEAMINRYSNIEGPKIIFELLNEIVLPNSTPWNILAHKLHKAIREINREAKLMVGGNEWNSVNTLNEIDLFDDPSVFYTFHFYEPLLFTHQKAYWTDEIRLYDKALTYPGMITELEIFLQKNPQFGKRLNRYIGLHMNEIGLRKDLEPALSFASATNKPLYCGEFGVIDRAPKDSRIRWYKDILQIFREYKIGYACWSYKEMDFGLVNSESHVLDKDLIKIIASST